MIMVKVVLVVFILIVVNADGRKLRKEQKVKTTMEYMEKLLKENPSIKSELPNDQGSTDVRIGIYLNSMSGVTDGQNMEQSVNLYLRHSWKDERLIFEHSEYGTETILLPDEAWKKIWVPDLFIKNEEHAIMHGTARENVLLKVNSTGYAWFVIKATTSTSCPMNLQKYPFDAQTCSIMFESFRYTMDTMALKWLDNPVQIDTQLSLNGFTLQDTILYDCSQNYTTGAYPCLQIKFVLRRDCGHFVMQLFIPTIVIVMLSWFSMWLRPTQYAQRIQLLIALIVILIVQYEVYGREVVDVSYVKAFDLWMVMCLSFIVAALLESTLVNVVESRNQVTNPNPRFPEIPDHVARKHRPNMARTIDVIARVVFPIVFIVLVALYFILFTVN